MIQVGSAQDGVFGAVVGQTLEIVPENNPVFVAPGTELIVGVRFRGVPLSGARLEAFSRNGTDIREASYTTDAAGRARLVIDRRGVWLIRMVHMVRCDGCPDADWESFWASYTFASADPSGAAVKAPPMLPDPVHSRPPWQMILIALAGLLAIMLGVVLARRRGRRRASSTAAR
jgi:hypothetical protein